MSKKDSKDEKKRKDVAEFCEYRSCLPVVSSTHERAGLVYFIYFFIAHKQQ